MPVQELEIPFPIHGRDDSLPASLQAPTTSAEGTFNMRALDGTSGRIRGAGRPGSSKACSVQLGSGPIRGLATTVFDDSHLTYDALSLPTLEWGNTTASGKDCYSTRYDRYGNVFAIDGGSAIAVHNNAGKLTATIKPAINPGQILRALHVSDVGRVYCGVSGGGVQSRARVFAYHQDPYLGWIRSWELDVEGYVEKIATFEDKVLCATNDVQSGKAAVVVVGTVAGLSPIIENRFPVLAPVNCLAVNQFGDIVVGSGINASRGVDPRHPDTGQILERAFASWWIDQLASYVPRSWCVFDAMALDMVDGADLFEWADTQGSNRKFYVATEPVDLSGVHTPLTGSQPADNDTITLALPDGSYSEVYRFKNTLAQVNDVKIGANLGATLSNFETVLEKGGDGAAGHDDTEPSRLAFYDNAKLKCLQQNEVVDVTLAGSGNLKVTGGAATTRILSKKTVIPTPPKYRKNGAAGRPFVEFDGISSKMLTLPNPNVLVSGAADEHTIYPGWGNNLNVTASARFAYFMVVKPRPSYSKGCVIAQRGKAWTRRTVLNRNSSGAFEQGKIGMVEKIRTGAVTTHSGDYMVGTTSNLLVITIVSEPSSSGGVFGKYQVRINGTVLTSTNEAEANDALERTALGQSSYAPEDERFAAFELYKIVVLRDTGGNTAISLDEIERVESALAHEHGAQNLLAVGHTYKNEPPPPNGVSTGTWHTARRALSFFPTLTKLERLTGNVQWIAASDGASNTISGIGYGVAFDSTGTKLFTCGVPTNLIADPSSIRMLIDKGDDYSIDPVDGAWSVTVGEESGGASTVESFTYDKLELAVDSFDNAYFPFFNDRFAGVPRQFWCYSKTGALLLDPVAENAQAVYGIAIDPAVPDYTGNPTTIDRAKRIALACRREASTTLTFAGQPLDSSAILFTGTASGGPVFDIWTYLNAAVTSDEIQIGAAVADTLINTKAQVAAHRLLGGSARTVVVTQLTATSAVFVAREAQEASNSSTSGTLNGTFAPAPAFAKSGTNLLSMLLVSSTLNSNGRRHAQVAVVDGLVKLFDATTVTPATVQNGAALDPAARYVQACSAFGKVYVVDGKSVLEWDAKTNTVQPLAAEGEGRVPDNCRIIELFAGGLFLAAGPDSHNWFLSGRPRPRDWNYNPAVQTDTQAWNGDLGPPGRLPDAITGFMPLFDDLAIVFCDHHTYRMTGDPAANGRFDPISDIIGASFGRAWAVGPDQRPFFWSQQGGLYTIEQGVRVVPVSGRRLDFVLRQVDLTKFYVRMAWNWEWDGLDIFLCPFGGVSESPRTYFWERSVDGFQEDTRSQSSRDVTDVVVVDGDSPDDRRTILGSRDGWARTWDATSDTDDGAPIYFKTLIGPIQGDTRYETMISRLLVLLEQTLGFAFVHVYVSDKVGGPRRRVHTYKLMPGLNPTLSARSRGGYIWIEIVSDRRWAFEAMRCAVQPGPYRRIRS